MGTIMAAQALTMEAITEGIMEDMEVCQPLII